MKSYETDGLAHHKTMAEKKHPMPKHGVKHTHIDHHDDGTHSIRHMYHDGSESTHGASDMADVHEQLDSALGEEAGAEAAGAAPGQ